MLTRDESGVECECVNYWPCSGAALPVCVVQEKLPAEPDSVVMLGAH